LVRGGGADPKPYDKADETPPTREPIRGRPARKDQQRFAPSLIAVGSLLVVAAVVALVLYIGVNRDDAPDDLAAPSAAPTSVAGQPVATTAAPAAATTSPSDDDAPSPATIAPADVRITAIQAWDPDGDNGTENDTQAGLAMADNSESTSWPTECYGNEFLSGKRGVGLILTLSGPSAGTLTVESLNGPYQIDVLTTDGATAPTELDGWRQVGDTQFADQPGTVEVRVDDPATYVLVWLKELGRDEVCTERNPYRGRLGEISFVP
jgi:hypothetical protein